MAELFWIVDVADGFLERWSAAPLIDLLSVSKLTNLPASDAMGLEARGSRSA